jgi:hypothetical protein
MWVFFVVAFFTADGVDGQVWVGLGDRAAM